MTIRLIAACGAGSLALSGGASPPIEAWLQGEVEAAELFATDPSIWLEWETTTRTAVQPDNPHVVRYALLAADMDHWRLCEDRISGAEGGQIPFADIGWTDSCVWQWTPAWLVIADPSKALPKGVPLRFVGNQAFLDVACFRFGGLHTVAQEDLILDGLEVHSASWVAEFVDRENANRRLAFTGTWDDKLGRAFVTELVVKGGYAAGTVWTFDDWTEDAVLGEWVAQSVGLQHAGNSHTKIFLGARRNDESDLESCSSVPALGAVDPIRGLILFASATDYRGEQPVHHLRGQNGLETLTHTEVEEAAAAMDRVLQRVGPGIAGTIILGLIFIRLGKARRLSMRLSTPTKEHFNA